MLILILGVTAFLLASLVTFFCLYNFGKETLDKSSLPLTTQQLTSRPGSSPKPLPTYTHDIPGHPLQPSVSRMHPSSDVSREDTKDNPEQRPPRIPPFPTQQLTSRPGSSPRPLPSDTPDTPGNSLQPSASRMHPSSDVSREDTKDNPEQRPPRTPNYEVSSKNGVLSRNVSDAVPPLRPSVSLMRMQGPPEAGIVSSPDVNNIEPSINRILATDVADSAPRTSTPGYLAKNIADITDGGYASSVTSGDDKRSPVTDRTRQLIPPARIPDASSSDEDRSVISRFAGSGRHFLPMPTRSSSLVSHGTLSQSKVTVGPAQIDQTIAFQGTSDQSPFGPRSRVDIQHAKPNKVQAYASKALPPHSARRTVADISSRFESESRDSRQCADSAGVPKVCDAETWAAIYRMRSELSADKNTDGSRVARVPPWTGALPTIEIPLEPSLSVIDRQTDLIGRSDTAQLMADQKVVKKLDSVELPLSPSNNNVKSSKEDSRPDLNSWFFNTPPQDVQLLNPDSHGLSRSFGVVPTLEIPPEPSLSVIDRQTGLIGRRDTAHVMTDQKVVLKPDSNEIPLSPSNNNVKSNKKDSRPDLNSWFFNTPPQDVQSLNPDSYRLSRPFGVGPTEEIPLEPSLSTIDRSAAAFERGKAAQLIQDFKVVNQIETLEIPLSPSNNRVKSDREDWRHDQFSGLLNSRPQVIKSLTPDSYGLSHSFRQSGSSPVDKWHTEKISQNAMVELHGGSPMSNAGQFRSSGMEPYQNRIGTQGVDPDQSSMYDNIWTSPHMTTMRSAEGLDEIIQKAADASLPSHRSTERLMKLSHRISNVAKGQKESLATKTLLRARYQNVVLEPEFRTLVKDFADSIQVKDVPLEPSHDRFPDLPLKPSEEGVASAESVVKKVPTSLTEKYQPPAGQDSYLHPSLTHMTSPGMRKSSSSSSSSSSDVTTTTTVVTDDVTSASKAKKATKKKRSMAATAGAAAVTSGAKVMTQRSDENRSSADTVQSMMRETIQEDKLSHPSFSRLPSNDVNHVDSTKRMTAASESPMITDEFEVNKTSNASHSLWRKTHKNKNEKTVESWKGGFADSRSDAFTSPTFVLSTSERFRGREKPAKAVKSSRDLLAKQRSPRLRTTGGPLLDDHTNLNRTSNSSGAHSRKSSSKSFDETEPTSESSVDNDDMRKSPNAEYVNGYTNVSAYAVNDDSLTMKSAPFSTNLISAETSGFRIMSGSSSLSVGIMPSREHMKPVLSIVTPNQSRKSQSGDAERISLSRADAQDTTNDNFVSLEMLTSNLARADSSSGTNSISHRPIYGDQNMASHNDVFLPKSEANLADVFYQLHLSKVSEASQVDALIPSGANSMACQTSIDTENAIESQYQLKPQIIYGNAMPSREGIPLNVNVARLLTSSVVSRSAPYPTRKPGYKPSKIAEKINRSLAASLKNEAPLEPAIRHRNRISTSKQITAADEESNSQHDTLRMLAPSKPDVHFPESPIVLQGLSQAVMMSDYLQPSSVRIQLDNTTLEFIEDVHKDVNHSSRSRPAVELPCTNAAKHHAFVERVVSTSQSGTPFSDQQLPSWLDITERVKSEYPTFSVPNDAIRKNKILNNKSSEATASGTTGEQLEKIPSRTRKMFGRSVSFANETRSVVDDTILLPQLSDTHSGEVIDHHSILPAIEYTRLSKRASSKKKNKGKKSSVSLDKIECNAEAASLTVNGSREIVDSTDNDILSRLRKEVTENRAQLSSETDERTSHELHVAVDHLSHLHRTRSSLANVTTANASFELSSTKPAAKMSISGPVASRTDMFFEETGQQDNGNLLPSVKVSFIAGKSDLHKQSSSISAGLGGKSEDEKSVFDMPSRSNISASVDTFVTLRDRDSRGRMDKRSEHQDFLLNRTFTSKSSQSRKVDNDIIVADALTLRQSTTGISSSEHRHQLRQGKSKLTHSRGKFSKSGALHSVDAATTDTALHLNMQCKQQPTSALEDFSTGRAASKSELPTEASSFKDHLLESSSDLRPLVNYLNQNFRANTASSDTIQNDQLLMNPHLKGRKNVDAPRSSTEHQGYELRDGFVVADNASSKPSEGIILSSKSTSLSNSRPWQPIVSGGNANQQLETPKIHRLLRKSPIEYVEAPPADETGLTPSSLYCGTDRTPSLPSQVPDLMKPSTPFVAGMGSFNACDSLQINRPSSLALLGENCASTVEIGNDADQRHSSTQFSDVVSGTHREREAARPSMPIVWHDKHNQSSHNKNIESILERGLVFENVHRKPSSMNISPLSSFREPFTAPDDYRERKSPSKHRLTFEEAASNEVGENPSIQCRNKSSNVPTGAEVPSTNNLCKGFQVTIAERVECVAPLEVVSTFDVNSSKPTERSAAAVQPSAIQLPIIDSLATGRLSERASESTPYLFSKNMSTPVEDSPIKPSRLKFDREDSRYSSDVLERHSERIVNDRSIPVTLGNESAVKPSALHSTGVKTWNPSFCSKANCPSSTTVHGKVLTAEQTFGKADHQGASSTRISVVNSPHTCVLASASTPIICDDENKSGHNRNIQSLSTSIPSGLKPSSTHVALNQCPPSSSVAATYRRQFDESVNVNGIPHDSNLIQYVCNLPSDVRVTNTLSNVEPVQSPDPTQAPLVNSSNSRQQFLASWHDGFDQAAGPFRPISVSATPSVTVNQFLPSAAGLFECANQAAGCRRVIDTQSRLDHLEPSLTDVGGSFEFSVWPSTIAGTLTAPWNCDITRDVAPLRALSEVTNIVKESCASQQEAEANRPLSAQFFARYEDKLADRVVPLDEASHTTRTGILQGLNTSHSERVLSFLAASSLNSQSSGNGTVAHDQQMVEFEELEATVPYVNCVLRNNFEDSPTSMLGYRLCTPVELSQLPTSHDGSTVRAAVEAFESRRSAEATWWNAAGYSSGIRVTLTDEKACHKMSSLESWGQGMRSLFIWRWCFQRWWPCGNTLASDANCQ